MGLGEMDSLAGNRKGHPQTCIHKEKYSAGRPCLRRACHRIECGALDARSLVKTAEQLRKPIEFHESTCFKNCRQQSSRLFLIAIARQSCGDQRIIMGPYRAIVIRHRVVTNFVARDGPEAPTAKKLLFQQCRRQTRRPFWARYARKERMACIRGRYATRLLLRVER